MTKFWSTPLWSKIISSVKTLKFQILRCEEKWPWKANKFVFYFDRWKKSFRIISLSYNIFRKSALHESKETFYNFAINEFFARNAMKYCNNSSKCCWWLKFLLDFNTKCLAFWNRDRIQIKTVVTLNFFSGFPSNAVEKETKKNGYTE